MNKNFAIILGFLFALPSLGTTAKSPDFLVQTRIEPKTLNGLIERTRLIMSNQKMEDMLKGEVDLSMDDSDFIMDEVSNDPEFLKFQSLFSNIFGVKFQKSVLRIHIPKIEYAIDSLETFPSSLNVQNKKLSVNSRIDLKGIYVALTQGLTLSFLIPDPKTKILQTYLTAKLDPVFLKSPTDLPPLQFGVSASALIGEKITFKLESHDLSQIPNYVKNYQQRFPFLEISSQKPVSESAIHINPITLKLNQFVRTLNFESFRPVLKKKLPEISRVVFEQLSLSLQRTIGPNILNNVLKQNASSTFYVKNETIAAKVQIGQLESPIERQLAIQLNGDLCSKKGYDTYQEKCFEHEPPVRLPRSAPHEVIELARDEISRKLATGEADLILSLSEEYLNRAIDRTLQAKVLDKTLREQNMGIGPRGAFLILNPKGEIELYVDLLYFGEGKWDRIVVSERKPIRFPLRIATVLNLKVDQGTPSFRITTAKILSDVNEIVNGIPEYDMDTRLVRGFRKRVAGMVLKLAKDIEGKDALNMDLPMLKGVELQKAKIESSIHRRLNLILQI